MGSNRAVDPVSMLHEDSSIHLVEPPPPSPVADHLHSEDILQGPRHHLDLFANELVRVLDQIWPVPKIVIGQWRHGRRIPRMQMHPDLRCPTTKHVPPEILKRLVSRDLPVHQVRWRETVPLAEALKSRKKSDVAGCQRPRLAPEVVPLHIDCNDKCRPSRPGISMVLSLAQLASVPLFRMSHGPSLPQPAPAPLPLQDRVGLS